MGVKPSPGPIYGLESGQFAICAPVKPGLADLVALERSLNADTDLVWCELHEWHKPRTFSAVEESLDRVRHLLGARARLFGNLPRLNELLALVQLHLLRLDDPNAYARILRENHITHAGTPPPRRQHDSAGLTVQ